MGGDLVDLLGGMGGDQVDLLGGRAGTGWDLVDRSTRWAGT